MRDRTHPGRTHRSADKSGACKLKSRPAENLPFIMCRGASQNPSLRHELLLLSFPLCARLPDPVLRNVEHLLACLCSSCEAVRVHEDESLVPGDLLQPLAAEPAPLLRGRAAPAELLSLYSGKRLYSPAPALLLGVDNDLAVPEALPVLERNLGEGRLSDVSMMPSFASLAAFSISASAQM